MGNIQLRRGSWDVDNHSEINYEITSITPSVYDSEQSNYGLNRTISVEYRCFFGFDEGYEYSSYHIRLTINWGKNSNGQFVYRESSNSNGTLTIPTPSSFVSDVVPTITIGGHLYAKQEGGSGPDPEEYETISMTGTILGNTYIREYPDGNSEVIASIEYDSEGYFTLRTKQHDWYYSSWDRGWVHSSRIRF